MNPMFLLNFLRWVVRGVFVAVNNLYCIPTYCLWMVLLSPLKVISEELYWRIEGQCFYWLLTMVAFWSYSAGYHIIETGDDINPIINEECMVLVNHQSTSDVPLLMAAFSTRNKLLQNLSWIMDGVFKYTNFGIVSVLHGDFFIAAGRDRRDATLIALKQYLKDVYVTRHRKWIVLFPEGGFLRKRREAGHRYATRLKLPLLNNVTLPRLGAIQTIMNTIGPFRPEDHEPGKKKEPEQGKLKYVIDLTIAYPKGNPLDLGSVIFGYDVACDVRMHYRVFPIQTVPSDPDELQNWTYDRYMEKESLLEEFYSSGVWEPRLLGLGLHRTNNSLNIAQDMRNERDPKEGRGQPLQFHTLPDINKKVTGLKSNEDSEDESPIDGLQQFVRVRKRRPSTEHLTEDEQQRKCQVDSDYEILDVPKENYKSDRSHNEKMIQENPKLHNTPNSGKSRSVAFATPPEVGRKNHQDLIRIGFVHVFFVLSTTVHVYGFYWVFRYCQSRLWT